MVVIAFKIAGSRASRQPHVIYPLKTKLILLLITCCLHSVIFATEPGSAYIKNSGTSIMHLWVNGSYQGYLKPGETRYTVSDGFITNDSDLPTPSGGRTAVKESHAGWENTSKDKVSITFQFPGGERKTSAASINNRVHPALGWLPEVNCRGGGSGFARSCKATRPCHRGFFRLV